MDSYAYFCALAAVMAAIPTASEKEARELIYMTRQSGDPLVLTEDTKLVPVKGELMLQTAGAAVIL